MSVRIIVECDKCGFEVIGSEGLASKKRLIARLRENGWSVGCKTICPLCKPKNTQRS